MSDLFAHVETEDNVARAKKVILARSLNGAINGPITLVMKKLEISYSEASAILRDLVNAGWISEADHHGGREIL